MRPRKTNVEEAATAARPPKRITIPIGGRTQCTTPGRFGSRIKEIVNVLNRQAAQSSSCSIVKVSSVEEEAAAMAQLGRLDCRAAPPRRALSDDAKARAKAKRKAAYIPVDVSARFDWSKFELPNPIKIFGKDDVWIGDQVRP